MAVEIVPIEISVKAKADVKPINKIKEKANEAASATNKISKNMKKISTESKHSQNAFSKLGSSIKRILLYRAIRTALREITQAFSEGVKNLYQYSKAMNGSFANAMDRSATSLLYFKNALGTLIAPFIEMAVPLLEKGVDVIVEIINKINEAIAALRGQATYTRAIKYWKEYAEAAEKAKSATIGIDELNVIGDSNGNQLDYTKMFEEAKVLDTSISNTFMPIIKGVKDVIKMLNDWWGRNSSKILAWGGRLKENLIDPFANFLGTTLTTVSKNKAVKELLDGIVTVIDKISEAKVAFEAFEYGSQLVQTVAGWFDELSTSVKAVFDYLGSAAELMQPALNVLGEILKVVDAIVRPILALFNWLITVLYGFGKFLMTGLKTWDWGGAWDEFAKSFEDANKTLGDSLNASLSSLGNLVGATYGDPNVGDDAIHGLHTMLGIGERSIPTSVVKGNWLGEAWKDGIGTTLIEANGLIEGSPTIVNKVYLDGRQVSTAVNKANLQKGATFVRGYVM